MDHKEKLKEELRVIEGCERWLSRLDVGDRHRVLAYLTDRTDSEELRLAERAVDDLAAGLADEDTDG